MKMKNGQNTEFLHNFQTEGHQHWSGSKHIIKKKPMGLNVLGMLNAS